MVRLVLFASALAGVIGSEVGLADAASPQPAVEAVEYAEKMIYHSPEKPGWTLLSGC